MFLEKPVVPRSRRRSGLIGPLTLASAALILWACADTTRPATPTPGAAAFSRAGGSDHNEGLVVCAPRSERHAEANIGPRGGVIAVGGNFLIVPPGAVAATVEISATVSAGSRAAVQFKPHGLHFNVAPLLVLNAAGCSFPPHAKPVIGYIDDHGTILERIDGTFGAGGFLLSAPIHHFSGYAIAF